MAAQLKMRRLPVKLLKVKDQHLPGILGDFSEVVTLRMRQLRRFPTAANKQKIAFYEFLLADTDPAEYGKIQNHFLDPVRIDRQADTLKYLDPIIWFESKIAMGLRLNLDKLPPQRILDLGTGPGHFPVVARFFGHRVVGTELPRRSQGMTSSGHLYDALCEFYKVERVPHMIRPYRDLADIGGHYDMVTSFLAGFNMDENKQPWGAGHWNHFLASLDRDVLDPGGSCFLNLADGKITADVWSYLKARARWAVDSNKSLFFDDLAPFRAAAVAAGGAAAAPGVSATGRHPEPVAKQTGA